MSINYIVFLPVSARVDIHFYSCVLIYNIAINPFMQLLLFYREPWYMLLLRFRGEYEPRCSYIS